ncbi:MAG: hypothetical protein ACI4O4_04295, partial [Candidatus Ventricola sp.]
MSFNRQPLKQTGMMPVASPPKCCKSRCPVPEADALRQDLHNKAAGRRHAPASDHRQTLAKNGSLFFNC